MYVRANNLGDVGDLKSFIKKTRAVIHKIFPRELSPTRLLEDFEAKQKKKAKAKAVKDKASADAANAAQLDSLKKAGAQIASLQKFAPGVDGAAGFAPVNPGASGGDGPGASDGSLSKIQIAGLLLAAGGVFYLFAKGRKR